ncbi:GDYXXLXY domain-containing protein [Thiolapillus sp.]|uniref:GDYXXLXY domain-containing protein n=2 Tax=Thiolapillus sp. TaxID=2017437 RepID=UPI0025D6F376|nr:GDYXXLXY domain-containing protein [Thiolapillus sp.]
MFSLWRKARRENSAASRLLGSTSLRFALHGWQRLRFLLIGLVILVVINIGIYHKERLLAEAPPLLLKLAPMDPRSLMQGDYMALNYQISRDWRKLLPDSPPHDGFLVLNLDENHIGSFAGLYEQTRPLEQNQLRIRYRLRDGRLRIGSNAFFFQEGTAKKYRQGAYGEFRVGDEGESLLIALRDEKLNLLGGSASSKPAVTWP